MTSDNAQKKANAASPRFGTGGLALLVAAIALFLALYLFARDYMMRPEASNEADVARASAQLLGLSRPVQNTLDRRYQDADGDLLADLPADPAKRRNPDHLTMSYIFSEAPEAQAAAWKDFADYLSKATGKPVKFVHPDTALGQLKDLRDGKLDVTAFNTGSVPQAVTAAGFIPVAAVDPPHKSVIIVPAGSPIKTLADIKGHTLTTVDPSSNSGYRAPIVELADIDLLPERDFYLRQSYSHDASIAGIVSKQYEVAATASDVLDRAVAAGKVKPEDFVVIYTSERFPSAAIGYAHDLDPALAAKIRTAIIDFNAENTTLEAVVSPKSGHKFLPVHYKDDWSLVRRIDNTLGRKYRLP